MCGDENLSKKIDLQLVLFKKSKGIFGCSTTKLTRKEKSPADWWDSFGDDTPEQKQFAIRVLSLTCSSSGCERNWSAFEMVHSKRINRLQQQKMNDLVYVMYNLKLSGREERKRKEEDFEKVHFEDVEF
ncbi:zf-BED domain-containing protein [Tanacetum coccineum]